MKFAFVDQKLYMFELLIFVAPTDKPHYMINFTAQIKSRNLFHLKSGTPELSKLRYTYQQRSNILSKAKSNHVKWNLLLIMLFVHTYFAPRAHQREQAMDASFAHYIAMRLLSSGC